VVLVPSEVFVLIDMTFSLEISGPGSILSAVGSNNVFKQRG